MTNNSNTQVYTIYLLIGFFLLILGITFLFLLDTTDPLFFVLSTGLILIGLTLIAFGVHWLQQLLQTHYATKEVVSFGGMGLFIIGLSILVIQTVSNPPELNLNQFGFFWFVKHDDFVWSFLPAVVMLLGYLIIRAGTGVTINSMTGTSTIGITCSICSLTLKQNDEISRCHHCGLLAHQTHLLEWVKTKGTCPRCINPLMPDQIL